LAEPAFCDNTILTSSCRLEGTSGLNPGLGGQEYKPPDFEFWHALNCLAHGIRIINIDYTVTFVNDAFASMAGISANEMIGRKCWEVFKGPFCSTPDCTLNRILKGERSVNSEVERPHKDGTRIPCRVSAFPLYSPQGQLIGIMESFRDTTRRRELQEKLDESEDRYRALIELGAEVGESILMLQDSPGREGVITFISDQFCLMTGYSRQEVIGRTAFDFLAPDDRRSSLERHRAKMSGQSMPGLFEVSFIRKDGTTVPAELTSAVTQYKGKPANVIYLRDITSRKALEKALSSQRDKYQSLFEQAPTAIWEMDYSRVKQCIDSLLAEGITDLKGYFDAHPAKVLECLNLSRIIGVNRAAVSLWEAGSRQSMCSNILSLLSTRPGGLSRELDNIVAFARGSSEVAYDITDPTFKGNWKHLHARYHLLPGHEDDWSRVLASFTDITLQKQAEEQLRQYHTRLEETVNERTEQLKCAEDKLKGMLETERELRSSLQEKMVERIEFTRALVHELKTPLTPMMACSEALLTNLTQEPQASFARNVHIGATRLHKKVDELIDLAQGEVGILELSCRQINPLEIIREAAEYVRTSAAKKGHQIRLELPDTLPWIKADEDRLNQVLLNLLDNAIKYTPPPGVVTIAARENNSWLYISVTDTGMGISEQEMKYLFEPYKRFSSARARVGGLGLGLVLAKFIVESHGGTILVESSKGTGSVFTVKIPAAQLSRTRKADEDTGD